MNVMDKLKVSYTVSSSGDQHWLRAVSIPLAETLEQSFEHDDSIQRIDDLPDYLRIDAKPTADAAILIKGVVGIFATLGLTLGYKILDDVYEVKFRPAILKALGAADEKLSGANSSEAKALQLGIIYVDNDVTILITIVGRSFAEILKSENQILAIHSAAVEWIEQNEATERVHLYIVNGGKFDPKPLLFENLKLAQSYLSGIADGRLETKQVPETENEK